jgi:hypothetical protein
MSQILEQAETLRQQAIGILMAERHEIDRKLALLGADGSEAVSTTLKPRACARYGNPGAFFRRTSPVFDRCLNIKEVQLR